VNESLNILHVLRAPVGGLFRHVGDLARAQVARGHTVGVLCDSEASDRLTETRLAALEQALPLGVKRVAMARDIDWRDVTATRATVRHALDTGADVLHGHGAKGGAYARLAAGKLARKGNGVTAFYTPHGGSLHYAPTSLKGRVFMALERRLARHTDGIIFESAYSSRIYAANVGMPAGLATRVIPNGIRADELEPVQPDADAADFVFVGELRHLKGVDLLLAALARLDTARAATAVIVGDGPDAAQFRAEAERLGLAGRVSFPGAMPARRAFALGRSLVMPSRAESFPYIVLEAGGAALPMIATSVGGIPEIADGSGWQLVESENVAALADAMTRHLDDPAAAARDAARLRDVIAARYSVDAMTDAVLAFYRERHRR
jgi:glycosyltransferase involved in cell wall biosynthesis